MVLELADLDDEVLMAAAKRLNQKQPEILETQRNILNGRPTKAESETRKTLNSMRIRQKISETEFQSNATAEDIMRLTEESLIGVSNDIMPIEFLEAGLLAKRPVGRIYSDELNSYGTGFLVGKDLVLTNNHVLRTPADASGHSFQLDYEESRLGGPVESFDYFFDPDRFFYTSVEHDFTLVAVTDLIGSNPPLSSFGWHVFIREQGKILKGQPVNIIQHPEGKPKCLVVHNSNFLYLENQTENDIYCWYSGDTLKGSSGSPVFNRFWEVIALHHKAVPRTNDNNEILDKNGRTMTLERARANPGDISYAANEGIRASRVLIAIENAEIADPGQAVIRDELLKLWQHPAAWKIAQHASIPPVNRTV